MRPDVTWQELSPSWRNADHVVFLGSKPIENRHRTMAEHLKGLPNVTAIQCTYEVGEFWARLEWADQRHEVDVREIFGGRLRELVKGRSVVVDITTLPHPLFLALVHQLAVAAPSRVYCTYAEPADYARVTDGNEFVPDLTAGFGTLRVLPSLVQEPAEGEILLIGFLGFEGDRLKSLLENEQSVRQLVPVLPFPAYRAGWHLRTMRENFSALHDQNYLPFRPISASSPFEARNAVLEIAQQNADKAVKVALLGTRPHALGALLARLANDKIHLVYDHPIEKSQRSLGLSHIHVYDISRDLGCPKPSKAP